MTSFWQTLPPIKIYGQWCFALWWKEKGSSFKKKKSHKLSIIEFVGSWDFGSWNTMPTSIWQKFQTQPVLLQKASKCLPIYFNNPISHEACNAIWHELIVHDTCKILKFQDKDSRMSRSTHKCRHEPCHLRNQTEQYVFSIFPFTIQKIMCMSFPGRPRQQI